MIHGFLTMQGWIPLAGQAIARAGRPVKDALKQRALPSLDRLREHVPA